MSIQYDIALVNKYLMKDLTPSEPTVQAFNRIAHSLLSLDNLEKRIEAIERCPAVESDL